MNIKMRYLAAIAAGMLIVANTAAPDERPTIVVGVNASSCHKFIADTQRSELTGVIYFSWAQGFLSGLNLKYFQSWESATDISNFKALQPWIKNYCEENPLDDYVEAISELWHYLRARQVLKLDVRPLPKE